MAIGSGLAIRQLVRFVLHFYCLHQWQNWELAQAAPFFATGG